MIQFIRSFPERIDRAMSGNIYVQIGWVFATIVIICGCFVTIAHLFDIPMLREKESLLGSIQGVYYHFIDPGFLLEV